MMTLSSDNQTQTKHPAPACADCPIGKIALYASLAQGGMHEIQKIRRGVIKMTARQIIIKSEETLETVYTVLDGWAYRFMMLPDGRRQIFSYYLPGDTIALEAFTRPRLHFSVRSLTTMSLCSFDKGDFWNLINSNPELMNRYNELCTNKALSFDNRLMDIGKRKARERLIRLIMFLYGRLVRKKIAQTNEFFFPLRHDHIADTIGLTPVHVSRNLNVLRRENMIDIQGRKLILLDEKKLLAQAELEKDYIEKQRVI